MKASCKLCGCLSDASLDGMARWLASSEVDLLEWRMDLFFRSRGEEGLEEGLSLLGAPSRLPVLATFRPERQGGAFRGPEGERFRWLRRAVEAGARWVDLEADAEDGLLEEFLGGGSSPAGGVVLSDHDFSGTPGEAELARRLERMARRGPRAVKLVTAARSPSDNLRVLGLVERGRREFGVEVIAFCMGPRGRWGRAASLLLGAPWAYVRLEGSSPSAPGQWTAREMRGILEALEGNAP